MNVLYLAHRIPYPPDKGDKIRSFHQVRHLGERHRVSLVCFADEPGDRHHADALRAWCASVDVVYRSRNAAKLAALRGLLDGRSLSVAAFESAELRRAAETRAADADVAVAFSSVMAQYVPAAAGLPKLMDFVDVDSDKWRLYAERRRWPASWVFAREAERLGRFEEEVARTWDHSLFVSEREARLMRPRAPGRPITVLRNGVDLEFFQSGGGNAGPVHPGSRGGRPVASEPPADLVFTGMMDYFPNVDGVGWFCDAIWPRVRDAVPAARFAIVGRNPSRSVRRLGRRPGVVVTGSVPDVRPYLSGASAAVAPLRLARGMQNKVLEAMASGLPVVGTPEAFDGLDVTEEAGLEAAAEPALFAERVIALLRDPERRSEQGRRARAYVERHHRWSDHGAALEALLARLVRGAAAAPGV